VPSVLFNYRIDDKTVSPKQAAVIAREALLREWDPYHWHLDSVTETPAYYMFAFSAMIHMEGWRGDNETVED